MVQPVYNEAAEARRFVCTAIQFRPPDEQAVFDALHANFVREQSRFGLKMPNQRESWEAKLAAVEDFLSMDDPLVIAALADGETAFCNRVYDRIWRAHKSEFDVPRCPECDSILKTHRAQQCLWCGHDWH